MRMILGWWESRLAVEKIIRVWLARIWRWGFGLIYLGTLLTITLIKLLPMWHACTGTAWQETYVRAATEQTYRMVCMDSRYLNISIDIWSSQQKRTEKNRHPDLPTNDTPY